MRTTKTLSISLPPEQLKQIEQLAKKDNLTMSELVRAALRRYHYQRNLEEAHARSRRKIAELGITEDEIVSLIHQSRKEKREKRINQPTR